MFPNPASSRCSGYLDSAREKRNGSGFRTAEVIGVPVKIPAIQKLGSSAGVLRRLRLNNAPRQGARNTYDRCDLPAFESLCDALSSRQSIGDRRRAAFANVESTVCATKLEVRRYLLRR